MTRSGDMMMIEKATKSVILAAAIVAFLTYQAAANDSVFDVAPPALELAPPPLTLTARAPVPAQCHALGEITESLETSIIDSKARYWAYRAHRGRTRGLISNPGSEIRSGVLRRQFYDLFNYHYANTGMRGLSSSEENTLKSVMERMLRMRNVCGDGAPELRRTIRQMFG
ncbi:MAG: hypothetical protein ABIJ96_10565 [Elusimicrobiota bacterium]